MTDSKNEPMIRIIFVLSIYAKLEPDMSYILYPPNSISVLDPDIVRA